MDGFGNTRPQFLNENRFGSLAATVRGQNDT